MAGPGDRDGSGGSMRNEVNPGAAKRLVRRGDDMVATPYKPDRAGRRHMAGDAMEAATRRLTAPLAGEFGGTRL